MLYSAQLLVMDLLSVAILAIAVFALVDCLRRPAEAFTSERKLTKPIWTGILAVVAALAFIAVPPLRMNLGFLNLIAAVAAIVYLVDVRPRLAPYRRRGPRKGSGGW
ncbi:DUF2516 family protein [Paraoerskovia marina]|uniref:DUF2516 domain-containing protein n=1 Tax=Paraoerskovia marina TaxID=545619 RepID=A0A1H1PTX4_9CELL|nr:DUF2516 family protein [Paraoerskovia marina]SDS14179.1 Protein of unknown function [Paraoerskovia marina]